MITRCISVNFHFVLSFKTDSQDLLICVAHNGSVLTFVCNVVLHRVWTLISGFYIGLYRDDLLLTVLNIVEKCLAHMVQFKCNLFLACSYIHVF